jgi:hypothetical protein
MGWYVIKVRALNGKNKSESLNVYRNKPGRIKNYSPAELKSAGENLKVELVTESSPVQ